MISKGSRLGVGSLIRGQAFRGPQGGKWRPAPLYFKQAIPYNGSVQHFNWKPLVTVTSYSPQDYALFFQQGEEQGFAYFFRQLYPALTLFAYKITGEKEEAEEIAANAFIKIWQRHHRFNSPESIRAYLYQIVRNDALKAIQKVKRQQHTYNDVTYLWKENQQKDHFHHLVSAETTRQLHETMDGLPPECSRIIRLLYVDGKSVKEIAQELNLSVSTVKTQKARGVAVLKKRVQPYLLLFYAFLAHLL